jgi:hypothetical protein
MTLDRLTNLIATLRGPLARIVARYLIGAFTAYALLTPEVGEELAADPDLQIVLELAIGGAMTAMVEGAYVMAKRWGWCT